tara:strand:+ start:1145 stop:1285 length:141 start_codon:yes stop_codon:yes gene_type:complete
MNKLKKAKREQETKAAEVGSDDDMKDPEISVLQHSLKYTQRETKRI